MSREETDYWAQIRAGLERVEAHLHSIIYSIRVSTETRVQQISRPVRIYGYHLLARAFGFSVLFLFPLGAISVAAYVAVNFPQPELVNILETYLIFISTMTLVAVLLVYAGRLGFWIRRTIIQYWQTCTLPIINERDDTRRAHVIEKLREAERESSNHYTTRHVILAVIFQLFGIILVSTIGEIEWITNEVVLRIFQLLLQFFAVMLGGIPGVVGVAITVSELQALVPVGKSLATLLIFSVFLPALVLTVSVRNLAYRLEFMFHRDWREGRRLFSVLTVVYLFLFGLVFLYSIFPEYFSILPIILGLE